MHLKICPTDQSAANWHQSRFFSNIIKQSFIVRLVIESYVVFVRVQSLTPLQQNLQAVLFYDLIFGSNKRPSLLNNLKFRSNVRPSFQPTSGCSESFYTQECQALRSKLSADTHRDVISDGNLKHLTIDAKLTD